MATTCPQNPADMSEEALKEEISAILARFNDYARGCAWGWDWPTMRAVFPREYARGRTLSAELKRRRST